MFILAEFPNPRTSCIGMIAVRATEDNTAWMRAQEISSSSVILRCFSTWDNNYIEVKIQEDLNLVYILFEKFMC